MAVVIEGDKNIEVNIEDKEVLRLLGYNIKSKQPSQTIYSTISELRKQLHELLEPKAVYQIFDLSELKAREIYNSAEKISFCICTIGSKLEQRVSQLIQQGDMLRALILDAFGSDAVEQVEKRAYKEICQRAEQLHLKSSVRFSPGYGKWSLEEQHYIFSILPANIINVSLTCSLMMIPRKSVSFAVKLGAEEYGDKNKAPCEDCTMHSTCRYRRE
jgi:cobalamin-dependent methionine synthase I